MSGEANVPVLEVAVSDEKVDDALFVSRFGLLNPPSWLVDMIRNTETHARNGISREGKDGYVHNLFHTIASYYEGHLPAEFTYSAVREYFGLKSD